jgi:16S rRNA (cytidine1402-2'-O)-methyltransferase
MPLGKLYIVATPIGNLEDITLRGLRTLKEVDMIAAEDTRHTAILLHHYGVKCPMISFHKFNESKRQSGLIEYLLEGKQIALVSDAGMPGVSDPGGRIIQSCLDHQIPIEVIPGASAVLHALVGSGLKMVPFYFGGFFPVKDGQRRKEIAASAEREATSVFFESPHRIVKTLEVCAELIPDRKVSVARELTKKFEEIKTGTSIEVRDHFIKKGKVRGEITFLIEGLD